MFADKTIVTRPGGPSLFSCWLVAAIIAALAGCSDSSGGGTDAAVDGPVDAGPDTTDGTAPDSEPPAEVVSCNNSFSGAPAQGTCSGQSGSGEGVAILAQAVLAPDKIYENGHVLYVAQQIVCVGCDCADHPQFADATRIECPRGVVTPGLINLHDHLGFTEGTPPTWTARYDHRHEWRKGQNGKPKISTPSNKAAKDNIGPLWGELRQVLAGTTSIAGAGGGDGLLRNLDSSKTEGLSGRIDAPTFPLGDSDGHTEVQTCNYDTVPTRQEIEGYQAWIPHVAEGNNDVAHNEFACLSGQRPDGADDTTANATFIHAVALKVRDVLEMAESGTGVNWSARSNISLYGMTADVVMLKNVGVALSLGSDWTYSGSINILREMACVNYLNETHFDNVFSARDIWRMVTSTAADQAGFGDRIGRLKEGHIPDISVFDGSEHGHYEAVTRGNVSKAALVIRGGKPIHGDEQAIQALGGTDCEAIDVCGQRRRLCLSSEIGLTLEEMKARFPSEVDGQPYAPYPLFFCGPPDNEPTCVPSRPGEFEGGPTAGDSDGDGVADDVDTCPRVFNPPRPMHGGEQPDEDSDGVGDECDPCPLDKDTTVCSTTFNPDDRDGDGIANEQDNCPEKPNKDQADSDGDDVGDACDLCPQAKGTCPFLIKELRDASLGKQPPAGSKVRIEQAVVIAIRTVRSLGYYVRQGKGPYEALFIFTSDVPTASDGTVLEVGHVVNIEGTITVYHDTDEIEDPVTEIVGQGGDASALGVKTADLQPGSQRADELESQLVRVSNAVVKSIVTGDDDFWVSDDGQACTGTQPPCALVGDYFYDGDTDDAKPAVTVGQTFGSITGVVNGFDSNHSLDVRNDADLVQ